MPASHLCQLCIAHIEMKFRRRFMAEAFDIQKAEASAKAGCPTCALMWNRAPELAQLEIPPATATLDSGDGISSKMRRGGSRKVAGGAWNELSDSVLYDANPATLLQRNKRAAFSIDRDYDEEFVHILTSYESEVLSDSYRPAMSTGAPETLDLAEKWMRKCISSHVHCAAYRRSDWAPTRLIKVLCRDDGKISVKLQEQAEHHYNSNVRYLALSHRWLGDNEHPLLSHENRSQFSYNIDISSLKPSIRDAIFATVRHGFQYLWVDTLCILQENENDKKHEIGEMDSVYSNAMCTIAAGVGETVNDGCFTSRPINQIGTQSVRLRLGVEEAECCLMRLSWRNTNRELDRSILNRRGWTFQERFLSPRTLHFCAKQVHWECREFGANETHPEGPPGQSKGDSYLGIETPWTEIVKSYTTRSLTFSTDRLRAIQGVADCLYRNSSVHGPPDKYLHGLWRSTLPRSLLWVPATPPKHDRQMMTAPTWSWASTGEQISFVSRILYGDVDDPRSSMIDTLEVLNSVDIRRTDENREYEAKNDVLKIRCRLSRPGYSWQGDEFVPQVLYGYKDGGKGRSTDRFLPMYKGTTQMRIADRIEEFQGIVVRALHGDCPTAYERVGAYTQYCKVGGTDAFFGEKEDIYLF